MKSILLLLFSAPATSAVIIQYHHVSNTTPPSTSISPALFREQMAYLHDNGFHVWPLSKLVQYLKQGKASPDKTIAITFDDGYLSIYEQAFPVLQHFHYPFTVFINTDLVGATQFMSWQQLRVLTKNGTVIANHAASHEHLIRRPDNQTDHQWRQHIELLLVNAEKHLEEKLGRSPKLLAYPYGEYNTEVKQIAKDLGFTAFTQLSGAFDSSADWQAIPRFSFGGVYTKMDSFIDKVNSLPMPLLNATVYDEKKRTLKDPLIPDSSRQPVLKLTLSNEAIASRIRCFATGQGRIKTQQTANIVIVTPVRDIPVGRSRYNCTAESDQPGRYYWHSQFFIRKQTDGNWYEER